MVNIYLISVNKNYTLKSDLFVHKNVSCTVGQEGHSVAQMLCEQCILQHGVPEELLSDQGQHYDTWTEMAETQNPEEKDLSLLSNGQQDGQAL